MIELPSGGLGVAEFSIFIDVDTANLLYAFRELRVKKPSTDYTDLMTIRRSRTFVPVGPVSIRLWSYRSRKPNESLRAR